MPDTATVARSNASKAQKAETTTRAAQQILNAEATAREAKTKRLRAARLAQEEATVTREPASKGKAAKMN